MPKLSIIVPIYNVEKYLPRCIESILDQTFTDFELILIDDGSPDRCGEICDEYAQKDSRILVFHQTNKGVSEARNKGLDAAKGEYIGFVDPDDMIEPEMYARLIEAAFNHHAQICLCNFSEQLQDSEYKSSVFIPEKIVIMRNTIDLMKIISTTYDAGILLVLQSLVNKIFDAETIKNISFSGSFGEDCDAINRIYSKDYKVHIINKPLYVYYMRNNSAIRTRNIKEQARFLSIYKERWSLFRDNEIIFGAKHSYCTSYLLFYYEFIKAGLEWTEDKKVFKKCFCELLKNNRCKPKLFIRGILYLFNGKMFCFLEDIHRWLYSKRYNKEISNKAI